MRIVPDIVFGNSNGLPSVYNLRIQNAYRKETLVFIHDDVFVDDYFLVEHVGLGLDRFDVIGVAGNRRRVPGQSGWAFSGYDGARCIWDERQYLSGSVAHGTAPFGGVSYYGPTGVECELLDGVFLAAKCEVLLDAGVRFDARFRFHFYDLDFCRTARDKGLRLGTWSIPITHGSGGGFGGEEWKSALLAYLEKWER
jgi:GT2 family glycosyltransferase